MKEEAEQSTPSRDSRWSEAIDRVAQDMIAILRADGLDDDDKDAAAETLLEAICPSPTLTDAEREAIRSLSPSGDPLASRTVTLTPDARRVFHRLLERLG
jgi:hypothetical protein